MKKTFSIGQEVNLDDINKIRNYLYQDAFNKVNKDHKKYRKEHRRILKEVKFIVKEIPNVIKNKPVSDML